MSRFNLVIQLLHFQFDSHSNASWGMIISIASCEELVASYHQRSSRKLGVTQLAAKLLHLSDENWIYAEELGFMISPFLHFSSSLMSWMVAAAASSWLHKELSCLESERRLPLTNRLHPCCFFLLLSFKLLSFLFRNLRNGCESRNKK